MSSRYSQARWPYCLTGALAHPVVVLLSPQFASTRRMGSSGEPDCPREYRINNCQVPACCFRLFARKARAAGHRLGLPYATKVGSFHPASLGLFLLLFNQLTKKEILAEEGRGESDVGPIQRLATDPERRSGAVCDREVVTGRKPVGGRAGRADRDAAWRAAWTGTVSGAFGAGGAAQYPDGAAACGGWTRGLSVAVAIGTPRGVRHSVHPGGNGHRPNYSDRADHCRAHPPDRRGSLG